MAYPQCCSMLESIETVEPLPLVPAMCTKRTCSCGLPSALSSLRMRSRLNVESLYLTMRSCSKSVCSPSQRIADE